MTRRDRVTRPIYRKPDGRTANEGMKKTIYEGKTPDGKFLRKGAYIDKPPDIAKMYITLRNGEWTVQAVRLEEAWGVTGYSRWINAVKVT